MIRPIIYSIFYFFSIFAQASVVDTIMIQSKVMDKKVQVVTIVPDKADKNLPCPVVYLLHGYSGNEKGWLGIKPQLREIADQQHLIFICPGVTNSWYWDLPGNPAFQYETFMANELISYVDSHYPTIAKRVARGITGLSMGGHGAMYLAMRHKELFGVAGSMSGGLDIRPFHQRWELENLLGRHADNRLKWDEYIAINQIERIVNGDLALIIDCGYDDFFFEVNNDFHNKLLKHGIMHDYYVRPGGHTGAYWNNAIDFQLLYMNNYFKKEAFK